MGATIAGIDEWRAALARIGPESIPALAKVHKVIADEGANQARVQASGMGGIWAKAAGAIKGSSTTTQARIGVSPGAQYPMANPAFWGALRHTGWYAKPQYRDGPPQFPAWVGDDWDTAVAGQGPYAINDALARYMPYLLEDYELMLDELVKPAFPTGL